MGHSAIVALQVYRPARPAFPRPSRSRCDDPPHGNALRATYDGRFQGCRWIAAASRGSCVGGYLRLQEKLIGVLTRPATEFAAIVGKCRLDLHLMCLGVRQNIIIYQVNRSDRQLGWVKPGPILAGMAQWRFGPVAVLCRSSEHILCSKGDEP
jgi:hypothetical protein